VQNGCTIALVEPSGVKWSPVELPDLLKSEPTKIAVLDPEASLLANDLIHCKDEAPKI
jgi:hypothetical protein